MNPSIKTIIALFVLLLVVAVGSAAGQNDPPISFDGKMAFLRSGDVYVANIDGTGITAITQTGGKIKEFRFSPGLEYMAAAKEVDSEIMEFVVYSVIVIDLATVEILAEIKPDNSLWPELGQWTAPDKLIYTLGSGYELGGFAEHDVKSNTQSDLSYQMGRDLLFAHFNDDCSLMLYTSDSGVGESFHHKLHLVDRTTGQSKTVARRRVIYGGIISHDKNTIIYTAAESSQPGTAREVFMLYPETDSVIKIESDSSMPIAKRKVVWSSGDSLMAFVGNKDAIVLARNDRSEVCRIEGSDHCWCDDNRILFGQGGNVHIYDLIEEQDKLLVENASNPVFLKAAK